MTGFPVADQTKQESPEAARRKRFIARMERKLAHKTAVRRRQFRARLQRLREW
jgi:hypothetical protein